MLELETLVAIVDDGELAEGADIEGNGGKNDFSAIKMKGSVLTQT